MSVYIRGMEMPKSCYGCPFFKQVDYWNRNDEADILSKCKQTGKFTWESVNGYLPDCPLIPGPEHGRLGDLDALEEYFVNDPSCLTIFEAIKKLQGMPTIIPASKEGEG